jgi:cytosine/adenosine deaminase-related metal-dependent hydrolase
MCLVCEFGLGVFAAAAAVAPSLGRGTTSSRLPARTEFVIKGAYVITIDDTLGEIENGSVHVRDGAIAAVGRDLKTNGARVIDGRGMIVLPGLVDTHWHMWHTICRNFAGDTRETGFFPTITRFASQMQPLDMYNTARLAAAEAINSGITTVHDWCHNNRSREHPEGELRALAETGIRAQFSLGQMIDQPDDRLMPLDIVGKIHDDWKMYAAEGLITPGMAWRGMFRNSWAPDKIWQEEFAFARGHKLPLSVHIGTLKSRTGHVEAHYKNKLLGPDINVVHACSASPDEIKMIADTGSTMSILEQSELRGGWGMPLLSEFLDAGVPTALGVDSVAIVGNCNLFNLLKIAAGVENVKSLTEFKYTSRRMLKLGTLDAARVLGLDEKIGSLTPGKRADIVMVSTDALNMTPYTDPATMLIESTMPENVDTVVVDGRILKQGGKLMAIETGEVIRAAQSSFNEVRKRTAWR